MSEEKEQYIPSPGKLRPNQIITTFGPGSIVQLQHDSVLVMGIDFWGHKNEYPVKQHHYLQKICNKEHFRMPMVSDSRQNVISCRSFPSWGFCPYCKRLQNHGTTPSKGVEFRCEKHPWNELLPARFVLTCENGHLEEFPWNDWAHIEDLSVPNREYIVKTCDKPDLRWYSSEKSSSIGDSRIHCKNCGKGNWIGKAFAAEGLPPSFKKCSGQIPWLDKSEKCVQGKNGNLGSGQTVEPIMKTVLTRSASLYYPQTITGLIIPELRHEIAQEIMTSKFKDGMEAIRENAGWTLEQIAEKYKALDDLRETYGVQKIKDFLEKIYGDNPKITEASTEFDLRDIEYHDIVDTDFPGDDEIKIESVDIRNGPVAEHVSQLKKFHRLTVLKVLRYFTRIQPPNPLSSEVDVDNRCYIGRSSTRKWLPCVANKGEGIFFSLEQNELDSWEKLSGVKDRCKALLEGIQEWSRIKEWDKTATITPKYILLHSLSHILIREIAKHAGYNEASISERIYLGDDYNAILLYTSGSSGDGSLGGLVRLGEPKEFADILKSAIKNSKICTRDPLCIEDDAHTKKLNKIPLHARLNNAACFGCMLVPETSCENFNKLLDRKLLFDQDIGFFHD